MLMPRGRRPSTAARTSLVEGYSRLMGTDEVGTLKSLTERRAILDRFIGQYRGRISNEASRRDYDAKRRKSAFEEYDNDDDNDEAATDSDWSVALEYFPDLGTLEARLRATSSRLAFAFRATLLETKNFGQRSEIAEKLETEAAAG